MSRNRGRRRKLGTPPTRMEVRAFAAYCAYGNQRLAADALGISEQTLKNHHHSLYRKLGLPIPGSTVLCAKALGWLTVPDEYLVDAPDMRGPDTAVTLKGMVDSIAAAVANYAGEHVERILEANEELLMKEAERRYGAGQAAHARVRRTA